MKTIALIVGHKQSSPGAVNEINGISEFEFNNELAGMVAANLQQTPGFNPVIIYRDTYSGLPAKVNATEADLAVSLHCNAFNKDPHGSETLYYHSSLSGKALASCIQANVVKCLGTKDRGIKPKRWDHVGKKGDRGGLLLQQTNMACVIVEPFFIDAIEALENAMENKHELARAISNGIKQFYGRA